MTTWIPEYLTKSRIESSDDQTLYIDLPKNEQISHLSLDVSCVGDSTPRTTTTLVDDIERYEVIADGSKVLFNLEPELAYYVDFITHNGVYPPMGFNYTPNARETHEFVIPFGRFPFDEDYLLDTNLYNNVQLRVPYNTDNARWQSGTFRHSVVMWRPLDRLSPVGLIRSRTIRKQTSATAIETLTHDLPTTYPLRYLAARFEDLDANISSGVSAIKLNIDEGRLILADLNINEWLDQDQRRYPDRNGYRVTAALSNETMVKGHTDYPVPYSILSSATRALFHYLYWAIGEQVGLSIDEADGTAVGDSHAMTLSVTGANPHKCLTLIDGRTQPFDVTRFSQGKVEYDLAAKETVVQTFVQEVVPGRLS